MKKKLVSAFIAVSLLLAVGGCKEVETVPAEENGVTELPSSETVEQEVFSESTQELFTGWLPAGVEQIQGENAPHVPLQEAIIDYYEIPEEYWGETKYYYNYVDLDGNGTNEIFTVIMGSYVGGSGGSSALWCDEQDGTVQIRQAFTLINTPIIVADADQDHPEKRLLLQRSGGGTGTELVQLEYKEGVYNNVADAQPVDNIKDITGTAIICNDLIKDMDRDQYLTLEDR